MKTVEEIKEKWRQVNHKASDLTISDIEFAKLYGHKQVLEWVLEDSKDVENNKL